MSHRTTKASRRIRKEAESEKFVKKTRVKSGEKTERKKEKREPVEKSVIKLEKKKTGIAAFREKDTVAGKAVKALTSLKTTAALAATLATGGAALGARIGVTAASAVITRTATIGITSLTTQRGFIGKSARSGLDKVFHAVRPIASRFASNPKSSALTTGFFLKLGLTIGTASLAKDAIGTYPFAGFIKEEALQTIDFAIRTAQQSGDIEKLEEALVFKRELLDAAPTIIDKIPYLNVQKQLKSFFEASALKLDVDEAELERLKGELSGELKSKFETEREKSDTSARQRTLEQRNIDAQYFALIREGKFEEAQALLDEELKGG